MTDSEGEGAAERERLAAEAFAGWQRRKAEDEKADQERGSDFLALQAAEFRDYWIATRSRYYGSFEDITKIPPMRFTDKPAPRHIAYPCDTLQIFSAKVAEIRGPYTGHSVSSVWLPCVIPLITIAMLSSTGQGITVRPSLKRILI